jgi:XTP/dITP diphosphohydrolase
VTKILVATTNSGKLSEIRALLASTGLILLALDSWPDLRPPDETGATFEENSRQKALYYAGMTGETVVAEDSGLQIDALGGLPGVHSARYGGAEAPYSQKFTLIEEALQRVGTADRSARFVCALTLARGGNVLFETRAVVEGRILPSPRGTGGFGYDPIFFYPPFGCTLAEATPGQKAAVSHRGQAFRALAAYLARGS